MHQLTDQEKREFFYNIFDYEKDGKKIAYRESLKEKAEKWFKSLNFVKVVPISILLLAIAIILLIVHPFTLPKHLVEEIIYIILGFILISAMFFPFILLLTYTDATPIRKSALTLKRALGKKEYDLINDYNDHLTDDLIFLAMVKMHQPVLKKLTHDQHLDEYVKKLEIFHQVDNNELSQENQDKINRTMTDFDEYLDKYQNKIEKLYVNPILDRTLMKIINDPKRKYYSILPKRIKAQIDNQLISNL